MPREAAAVSAQVLCTPYSHTSVYSATVRSHRRKMHVCNLPPALLAELPGSFTSYCGITGGGVGGGCG